MPRDFPFQTSPQNKDINKALRVFKLLWDSHIKRKGPLSTHDMQDVFHKVISDALSYADGGWRRGKYWSVDAWNTACTAGRTGNLGLVCEHVIPRKIVLDHAMKIEDYNKAKEFVLQNSFVCVITKDENIRLNKAGLAQSHPDLKNPWRRYSAANALDNEDLPMIKIFDVPLENFLNENDRIILNSHGLLFGRLENRQEI